MRLHDFILSGYDLGFANDTPMAKRMTVEFPPDSTIDQMRQDWNRAVVDAYKQFLRDLDGDGMTTMMSMTIDPLTMGWDILTHIQRYTDLSRHVDSHDNVILPLARSLWAHVRIVVFG